MPVLLKGIFHQVKPLDQTVFYDLVRIKMKFCFVIVFKIPEVFPPCGEQVVRIT